MAKAPDPADDKEFNAALRRALATPPTPHRPLGKKKPPKKKAAKRKPKGKEPG